jgi:hypothetical protein
MNSLRQASVAAMAVFALAVAGCNSKGAGRASVSGKVTFDGQPVGTGQIVFEPAGTGRLGIAQIVNGIYAMPAEQGPTSGSYIIRITADRPTGKTAKGPASSGEQSSAEVYEQYIPLKYNEQSELRTDIGAEASAVRDFDLKS